MFNGFDGFIEPWVGGKPPNVTSNNLAFVLGNGEFDVWVANNRGTAYSRNHTRLNPNTEFWDYSFADMGKYDVPAMVNYVIDKTEYDKIVYIGFSRGTEQIFIQLAENPSFADKLYLNINLAPIAFRGSPKGISGLVPSSRPAFLAQASYVGPIPPFLAEFDAGLTLFCSIPILKQICIEVYSKYFGPDRPMIDEGRFQVLTSLIDATSNKDNLHTRQAVYYDQIRKFDYGNKMNLELYGSDEPPKYPFENIPTYNLVLISGQNDYLATPENVQKLRNILNGTALVDYMIPYSKWSHTDFIFGNQAYKYSHSVIVKIMRDYFSQQSG
uniref:AB hydrolase-1 domain-containing protein n=1 Tax=Tetranychus urticae TaxID=32264 RepID=T1KPH6_TETUR